MLPLTAALAAVATIGALVGGSLSTSTQEASPRILTVDQEGGADARTIGEAVALADAGDTILVMPGTYRESVHVTEAITIRGDGDQATVVIEVPADGAEVPGAEGTDIDAFYGLFVEATDARIENLTVLGLKFGIAVVLRGGAPVLDAVTVRLQGDFSGGTPRKGHAGLLVDGDSQARLTGVNIVGWVDLAGAPTITDSDFPDTCIAIAPSASRPVIATSTLASCPWSFAIEVGNTLHSPVLVKPSGDGAPMAVIRNNDISATDDAVLVSSAGSMVTVTGNVIEGALSLVRFSGGTGGLVEDNQLRDGGTGVNAGGAVADLTIRGNTMSGLRSGITLTRSGAEVIGNTIRDNGAGLTLMGVVTATFSGNTICGNDQNVVVAPNATVPDLSGNEICPDASPAP